jgi:hypothetical protein
MTPWRLGDTQMKKLFLFSTLLITGVFAGAPALRAEHPGSTSGPATGTAIQPSTSVQKDNPHISSPHPAEISGPSGTAVGAPGIEGRKGTQSGKAWTPPAEIKGKGV